MGHKEQHENLNEYVDSRMEDATYYLGSARRADSRGDTATATDARARMNHNIDDANEATRDHKNKWGC